MRSLAILFVILVGVVAGIAWWTSRAPSSATQGAVAAVQPGAHAPSSARETQPAPRTPPTAAPTLSTSPPAREAPPERAPPRIAEAQGIEERGPVALPGPDFSWKYGARARTELAAELTKLEVEVQQLADEHILERFRREQFVEHIVAPEDARTIEQIVAALNPQELLFQSRVIVDPKLAARASSKPRPSAVRIVTLRREEFGDLYALKDECDWLRRYLAPGR